MRNLEQKKLWKNITRSKPFLILLGILILIFAWSVFRLWNKMGETSKNRKIIEDKVALLKQQKEKLSADTNSLNTAEGKEKFFRENFGLAKEGEDMIVVVEDKTPPVSPPTASGGFFSFLKNWFK